MKCVLSPDRGTANNYNTAHRIEHDKGCPRCADHALLRGILYYR